MTLGKPAYLGSLAEGDQVGQLRLAATALVFSAGHQASEAWCNALLQLVLPIRIEMVKPYSG